MKIAYKFAVIIVFIIMFSMIVLGLLFSAQTSKVIKDRISNQLQSVGTIKENQLNTYFAKSEIELEEFALDPLLVWYLVQFDEIHNADNNRNITSDFELFLNYNPQYLTMFKQDLDEWTKLRESTELDDLEEFLEDHLAEHFNERLAHSEFEEISVLTTKGIVDVSTNPDERGKIKSNEKHFINGLNSTYIQNFYFSVSTRTPTVTVSTPVYDEKGKVIGVISGNIHLNQISNIMTERSGLGSTGETILINKNHLLVSSSRFDETLAFKKTIYTEGLNECLTGQSGAKEYSDYRNVKVIGYFIWMSEREVCLVSKIDSEEAYKSLNALYVELLVLGCASLIFSLFMAFVLSKMITRPINKLIDGTEQWAKGNLNYKVIVKSNDEISKLCIAFNDASKEMLRAKDLDKNYTKDLKEELEQKTREIRGNLDELKESKTALLNIMEDISETNTHLKDLDKAKSDFLNVASHELKTPLTAISAYLEILDDYKGQFSPEQLQGLDAIKRNSNQLKMLIGNILEISRLDSGRFELNITEINVNEKVSLLVDNLNILANNKHLKLTCDCDGVDKISTDDMRFEEILNNLVSNAVKFTDNGSITIKTEWGKDEEKDFVVISVIDTGVGIPEDKMSELFQNFYQVDATISRKYGGTGLGLAITKKMIELQGGKITVNSIIGKGTTFRFTLPIQPLKKEHRLL